MSFLDNVPEENAFVLSNGARIMNLEELLVVIKGSDDSLFYDHVTPDRNDFANWIKFVIHHDKLFDTLITVKNKQDFLKSLDEEISYIKDPKLRDAAKFFSKDYDPVTNEIVKNSGLNAGSSVNAPNPVQNNAPASLNVSSEPATLLNSTNTINSNSSNGENSLNTSTSTNISAQSKSTVGEIQEFEQVLSMLIAEINSEIFSWTE